MRPVSGILRQLVGHPRPVSSEAGSATVEAVIGIPVFLVIVSVVIFAGRVAVSQQAVQTAASDAARAASLARTASAARSAATSAAAYSVANQQLTCASTAVTVDVSGFSVSVGVPASVSVTVSCDVPLDDLGVPGASGTRTVSATMTSPLDTYRGRR